ncbi:MAG: hypothetical protein ABIQ51_06660 [Mesorhizobium sp.]
MPHEQVCGASAGPVASKRTAPQRQPPVYFLGFAARRSVAAKVNFANLRHIKAGTDQNWAPEWLFIAKVRWNRDAAYRTRAPSLDPQVSS